MSQNPNIPPNTMEEVDGVLRYPPTGIKVIIAGGGIGGLMAALECWRKGNDVEVLERMASFSTIGDFFTITPSGLSTLPYYPKMHAEYQETHYDTKLMLLKHDGTLFATADPEWEMPGEEHPVMGTKVSFIKTRAFFGNMLLKQCERLGIKIHWGAKVVKFAEDAVGGTASVETEDGDTYTGDLVIAADGVGTKSNDLLGKDGRYIRSGYAISRIAFPASRIAPGSLAASAIPKPGARCEFRIYLAPDMHGVLMLTPDTIGFAFTHADIEGQSAESWHHKVPTKDIIAALKSRNEWDPLVLDFFAQAPDHVVDWELTWRDPNPVWTSAGGRVLQLGDAVHTYFPSSGNGAVQAVEDAITIGECLRLASATSTSTSGGAEGGEKAAVPLATAVHSRLRFQRTSIVQRLGFAVRNSLHHADLGEMSAGSGLSRTVAEAIHHGRWTWGHRPEKYAAEVFAEAAAHVRTGAPFEDRNVPPGYVYEPWGMEGEMERERRGLGSRLKETGDWR